MKLNSVILADDSADCNMRNLCVILTDNTNQLLQLYQTTQKVDVNNVVLSSDAVSKDNISEQLSQINNNNFISFWYGHGKSNVFSIAGEDIITTTENHYIFTNALIYTFSCLNGNELADVLITNGAKVFIGYKESAQCPLGIDDVTSQIAQTFIVSFVIKGKQVKEAVSDLKTAYNDVIYGNYVDPIRRSLFQTNRDSLVLKGNGNLTINDFVI